MNKEDLSELNLEGKFIVMTARVYVNAPNVIDRVFHCETGFGLDPEKSGTKIYGHFVADIEKCYVRRYDVERLATEEEVRLAKEKRIVVDKSFSSGEPELKGKQVGTIDVTPKWEALYPIYADWIDSGKPEQKQLVKDELLKLCKMADAINDETKRVNNAGTFNFKPGNKKRRLTNKEQQAKVHARLKGD